MTDTPTSDVEATCPDCPHPWPEHEHGGLGNGTGDGCYHRVDRDPGYDGDEKWCPCRRTPPLTALTADQLRALALAGRKWTTPDLSEEIAAGLREEHARLAREWAADPNAFLGGAYLGTTRPGQVMFVDWKPLADDPALAAHVRVIDLSGEPAGSLDPRRLAESALHLAEVPVTDVTIDAVLAITAPEAPATETQEQQ